MLIYGSPMQKVKNTEYRPLSAVIYPETNALFGVLQMVPLVVLPMVPLVANGTTGRANGTIGITIGTNGITSGTIGRTLNTRSFYVI